ncbi:hypothetical protein N7467_001399 [Penicillium canescens]|nr:hypothetical protein N7467_001399 [Penicillium canescens]
MNGLEALGAHWIIMLSASNFETLLSSASVLLFQAALVLWLFSVILGQSNDSLCGALSAVIGTSDLGNAKQAKWIETGWGRIKM